MIAVIHRPELVMPELVEWLRRKVSYEGTDGQAGGWLVRNEPLPPILEAIARAVAPGVRFDTVHFQGYRDGRATTPCHTDERTGFSAILSIGATRTLRIHRQPEGGQTCGDYDLDVFRIECRSGTVVFMDEEFYAGWHHQIPADPEVTDERLSIVFRTKGTSNG